MFALKGLNHCPLDGGLAHGGAASWIDDISMHASSFNGFKDLFRKVLTRLAFAGMSLKATKCYLLHQRLEVLGFFVTPDGIVMQPEAIERIERCGKDGQVVAPSNVKEIRTFLGAVQFYRRFVPRIAMLAAPMNELLKKQTNPNDPRFRKGTDEYTSTWDAVQQSFEAIMLFLRSSAVVSAPDLSDPYAEYVIVCDACDIAAGGALMQWQYPMGRGPGPPAGVPLRGGNGPDPLTQSWRLEAGWKLRTLGYFHKTFNPAQINYPTFDQEGAAILTCCRRWAKLITGRPTTIYTDSSVAATMLNKHNSTQRLARWGIELGTFMPYLKIQHRKGAQNGLADFISRYPTFERYVKRRRDELQLPLGAFDTVTTVPLFTHEVADEDTVRRDKGWVSGEEEERILKGWSVELIETTNPSAAEEFWHRPENLELIEETLEDCSDPEAFLAQIHHLRESITKEDFWTEQQEFNTYVHDWEIYSDIYRNTHDRKPVLWDLFCGEGGFSRGAQHSGFDCYGFDNKASCTHRYEHDPTGDGTVMPNGMTFTKADILKDSFWEQLMLGKDGEYSHLPMPDAIHLSPDCSPYSHLTRVGGEAQSPETWTINFLIKKLKTYERYCAVHHEHYLMWHIENVPDSRKYVTEKVDTRILLCGTMMGHQTFRHRVFYCNYPAQSPKDCRHQGKYVGSRGIRFNAAYNQERFGHLPESNMYGVYSRPYAARGSADEWHGALGHMPGSFSESGLRGALPTGYGRLLGSQMIAHSLHRQFACPVLPPGEREPHETSALEAWACNGYRPLADLNFCGMIAPSEESSVLEALWPHQDELDEPLSLAWPKEEPPGSALHLSSDELTSLDYDAPTLHKVSRTSRLASLGTPSKMVDLDIVDTSPRQTEPEQPPTVNLENKESTDDLSSEHTIAPAYNDETLDLKDSSPYVITWQDQYRDTAIVKVINAIKNTRKQGTWDPLWELKDDKLYRSGFSSTNEPVSQVYVPLQRRNALLRQLHYSNHRGFRPLFNELVKSYYWPNMASDCATYTARCDICAPLASKPLNKVATNPIPTPARPFTVLHVDHADFRGRVSGPLKYQYILIVTCALTRFTLFIPTTSSTAEDTLKALSAKVFCIFGPPLIIVSDNGPAFISNLAKACSRFWGYRHAHILPYNSQANGVAEASVKRIKLLLDRHCQGHRNWHTLVPVLQLKLKTDVHSGIKTSPYVALFGREPVGLEQLEDPSLYPETTDGDGFLHDLRGRMQAAHETLRSLSDTLKQAHADEVNARKHVMITGNHGIVEASTVDEPKHAWVIHGSKEQAAYVAKHGHGLPWKHKYKVLEARPHAVKLEIPSDGSVPRINEWQLRRRVARAPTGHHCVSDDDPIITESGLMMPGHNASITVDPVGGDPFSGDETEYEVESVKYAEKVGGYYKLWLKWKDSEELTWRWAHELRAETLNAELLSSVETAIAAERAKLQAIRKDSYAQQEDEFEEPSPADIAEPELLGRGAPRVRNRPDRLVLSVSESRYNLLDAPEVLSTAYHGALRRLSAAKFYLAPLYE